MGSVTMPRPARNVFRSVFFLRLPVAHGDGVAAGFFGTVQGLIRQGQKLLYRELFPWHAAGDPDTDGNNAGWRARMRQTQAPHAVHDAACHGQGRSAIRVKQQGGELFTPYRKAISEERSMAFFIAPATALSAMSPC